MLNSPRILIGGFPEDQRPAVQHVLRALDGLNRYVEVFRSALSLFDFAEAQSRAILAARMQGGPDLYLRLMDERRVIGDWQFIAPRDGAMTIYHFSKAMEGIRGSIHLAPALMSLVGHSKLRAAAKEFDRDFPKCEGIRHAIAHAAELIRDMDHAKKNSFTGKYDGPGVQILGENCSLFLRNGLIGRKFTMTWENQVISYEVNAVTITKLETALASFYAGFEHAAEESARLSREASMRQHRPSDQT